MPPAPRGASRAPALSQARPSPGRGGEASEKLASDWNGPTCGRASRRAARDASARGWGRNYFGEAAYEAADGQVQVQRFPVEALAGADQLPALPLSGFRSGERRIAAQRHGNLALIVELDTSRPRSKRNPVARGSRTVLP